MANSPATDPPRDEAVLVDSLALHYLDYGNEAAPPLLLVHGICHNAHYWDLFASQMRDACHVVTIDLRGHGDSGWADKYGPREYVLDLESFVTRLGLTAFTLVGHSLGGIISTIYAARHPEQVAKLVIIDIGPEIEPEGARRILDQWQQTPGFFQSVEEAEAFLKREYPRYSDSFVRNEVRYRLKRNESGKLVFKHDMALHKTSMSSPEWLWEYLGQIVCPTLVLRGSETDMLSPEVTRKMAQALPYGKLVEIGHATHHIPGDNPEEFLQAVREFLAAE